MEERRLREVKKLTRKEGCLGLNKGPPVSRMSEQRWFPGRAEQHQEKLGAEPEGRGGHCQSITSRPRTTDGMTMVQVGRGGDGGGRHRPDTRQTHGVVPPRPGGQPGKQSTHPRSGELGPKAPGMKGIMIRTTGFQGQWPTRRGTVVCFCPGPELSLRSADGGSLFCRHCARGVETISTSDRLLPTALRARCGSSQMQKQRHKEVSRLSKATERAGGKASTPALALARDHDSTKLLSKVTQHRGPKSVLSPKPAGTDGQLAISGGTPSASGRPDMHPELPCSALRIHLLSDFCPSGPNAWAHLRLALNRTLGNLGRADVKTLPLSVPSAGAKSRTAPLSLTKVG